MAVKENEDSSAGPEDGHQRADSPCEQLSGSDPDEDYDAWLTENISDKELRSVFQGIVNPG
jgi:hypothetical protein